MEKVNDGDGILAEGRFVTCCDECYVGLEQMHVGVLIEFGPGDAPILRRRTREPTLRQEQVPLEEKVALARDLERLAPGEGSVVMGKAEHGEGMAIEVLGGIKRCACKIDLEDPAAEAVIPEVLD